MVGELGVGKTTFVQGIAHALHIKRNVTSPTFTIFRKYKIPGGLNFLFHFDLYRIHDSHELERLGLSQIISSPENIVCVEWADRAKDFFPSSTAWIRFQHGKTSDERIAVIE